MSENERTLLMLGDLLAKVARPYACDEELPVDLRSSLWQLGVPCTELTPREELVARLWARKRTLQMAVPPRWGGGPSVTPPSAA